MRYIPTPDDVVERLKKQAKKLQRSGAGKHSDLLNRVAKQAGYDHWHHVVKCNGDAKAVAQMRSIRDECEAIMAAELRGQAKAMVTKDGPACPPFVLFSTGIGDAWLLEPDEHLAMCLVWQGKRQPVALRDEPDRIEVEWDGDYELLGDFFSVHTGHPEIGERAIGGYPLDDIRKVLATAKSTLSKMTDVIGQWDVVDITDEVVARFVKKGWTEERVLELKAEGYRYSPQSRHAAGTRHEQRRLGRRTGRRRRARALNVHERPSQLGRVSAKLRRNLGARRPRLASRLAA